MLQESTSSEFDGVDHGTCWPSENMAKPLHIQRVEEALKLDAVLAHVESLNKSSVHRYLLLGRSFQQLPVNLKKIQLKYTGKFYIENIFSKYRKSRAVQTDIVN